jgi:glucosylceramidase
VTIDGGGQVTKNEEYYALAHFSKFVKPGAKRVSSTEFNSSTGLKNVAFINPDGSRVLVVLNESATSQKFSAIIGATKLNYTVEANAVATFVWK